MNECPGCAAHAAAYAQLAELMRLVLAPTQRRLGMYIGLGVVSGAVLATGVLLHFAKVKWG